MAKSLARAKLALRRAEKRADAKFDDHVETALIRACRELYDAGGVTYEHGAQVIQFQPRKPYKGH
jgi:hypothetical protein